MGLISRNPYTPGPGDPETWGPYTGHPNDPRAQEHDDNEDREDEKRETRRQMAADIRRLGTVKPGLR